MGKSMRSLLHLALTALFSTRLRAEHSAWVGASELGKRGDIPRRHLPFAGNGTCEEPQTNEKVTTVRCLGPEMPMLPGQTIDAFILLESPYPRDRNVTVIKQEAQMVAKVDSKSWREVPLTELYFHHVVPNPRFLLGEGAEVRGSRLRKELEHPRAFVVDGKMAAEPESRLTNLQLVNTIGVAPERVQRSIECWCGHEELGEPSDRGSLFCCKQSYTNSTAGLEYYQLEYNVTFREVEQGERPISFLGYDVAGGVVEYNIPSPLGPNTSHTKAVELPVDRDCPQTQPFEIVRCTAHQHIGGQCMHVYDLDADTLICRSCPVYGTENEVPGNELGYVVAIQDDDLSPGYKIKPGTRIRVDSVYDGSQRRLGVMGIMAVWVTGLSQECSQFSAVRPMSALAAKGLPDTVTVA